MGGCKKRNNAEYFSTWSKYLSPIQSSLYRVVSLNEIILEESADENQLNHSDPIKYNAQGLRFPLLPKSNAAADHHSTSLNGSVGKMMTSKQAARLIHTRTLTHSTSLCLKDLTAFFKAKKFLFLFCLTVEVGSILFFKHKKWKYLLDQPYCPC